MNEEQRKIANKILIDSGIGEAFMDVLKAREDAAREVLDAATGGEWSRLQRVSTERWRKKQKEQDR